VVIDKVLNHESGAVKGIAALYPRGEYLDQRKTSMDGWAYSYPETGFETPR
jgi:hypothetical protein